MGKRQCAMEGVEMSSQSFWDGKNILITGHTGFKGSWLCKIFETLGANVVGYALTPSNNPNLYDICKPNVKSIIADIRDYDKLLATFSRFKPEIVIHMAAQPLVLDSYKAPRYTYDVNVMGTVNLLECVRQTGGVKSLLNVTTDKVYLDKKSLVGFRENEPLNGYDPYSNSKSCSELVTSSYNNSFLREMGVAVSTARSGNVIGGGDFASNRLIPDCARALSQGETVKIRNPDSVRPYLHVLDTLFAYIRIVQKQYNDVSFAGAYNIGPNENNCAKTKELAKYFCETWGNGANWIYEPTPNPHESGLLTLNCSKAECVLDWVPRWDIIKAVKETAIWYQAYYTNDDTVGIMTRQIINFLDS
jgi:CDP-glucose 4,6-dehydratase